MFMALISISADIAIVACSSPQWHWVDICWYLWSIPL